MSQVRGLLVTCHRCGDTAFRKYEETGSFDGGYTNVDFFEKEPEGWTHDYPKEDGKGYADLCPKCSEAFMKLIYDFYS